MPQTKNNLPRSVAGNTANYVTAVADTDHLFLSGMTEVRTECLKTSYLPIRTISIPSFYAEKPLPEITYKLE